MTKPAPPPASESPPPEIVGELGDPAAVPKRPKHAVLRSVRFVGEAITLTGVNPTKAIHLGEPQFAHLEAQVVGPSVFIKTRGRDGVDVIEVPRVACVLRWELPDGTSLDEATKQIAGRPPR